MSTHGVTQETLLFRTTSTVHDGPFKAAGDGEEIALPFSIAFPDYADPRPPPLPTVSASKEPETGRWTFSREDQPPSSTAEPLPPSFRAKQPKSLHNTELRAEYWITTHAHMPHLADLNVLNFWDKKEVHYSPPRIPHSAVLALTGDTNSFDQPVTIQSKFFLPPGSSSAKPTRSKIKTAILGPPPPTQTFHVFCPDFPKHLFASHPLRFTVIVSTTLDSPPWNLETSVRLFATTTLVSETNHPPNISIMEILPSARASVYHTEDGEPKTVNMGLLPPLPASFSHADVSRSYKLRVVLQLVVVDQTATITRQFPVIVHPPIEGTEAAASSEGDAPVTYEEAVEENGDSEQLPAYEEVAAEGGSGRRTAMFSSLLLN